LTQQLQQVLYDMALAMAGEPDLERLTRSFLQRLLYHSNYSIGLLVECETVDGERQARLVQSLGARSLLSVKGEVLPADADFFATSGAVALEQVPACLQPALRQARHCLRMKAGEKLCFLLASQEAPGDDLLAGKLEPILVRFAEAYQIIAQADRQRAELQRAKESAERANAAKDEFLSRMSHELRTPMNAILGFGQLLESEPELSPDQQEYTHEILTAGRHLLALINEILDLARVESGNVDLDLMPIGVDKAVDDCLAMVRATADARGVKLSIQRSTLDTQVTADTLRLRQALLNLLSNAIKYNRPQGRVDVDIQATEDGFVRVTVQDTGNGIPAERLDEIFEPFNRLGADLTDIEGTGIGLTITQRLVELMHGRVGVRSVVGEGSAFWLDLPAIRSPDAPGVVAAGHPVDNDAGADHSPRLLYVDANTAHLKLVRKLLAYVGFDQILEAGTVASAIVLAQTAKPTAILVDLDGVAADDDTLRQLAQALPPGETRLVAVASDIDNRRERALLAAGCDACLRKPLTAANLGDSVRAIRS